MVVCENITLPSVSCLCYRAWQVHDAQLQLSVAPVTTGVLTTDHGPESMFSIFSLISLLTITIPSSVSASPSAAASNTPPQSCPDVGYIDFEQLLNTFTKTRSFTETGEEARDKKYCKKDPYHVFRYEVTTTEGKYIYLLIL